MARLLVKAVDYTHPDPEVDKQGAYKRGDVVCVMPDDHVWGLSEGLPKFEQVDMLGASVESLQYLIGSEIQNLEDISRPSARKNTRLRRLISSQKYREVKRRRRYTIDLGSSEVTDKVRMG